MKNPKAIWFIVRSVLSCSRCVINVDVRSTKPSRQWLQVTPGSRAKNSYVLCSIYLVFF